MKALDKLHFRSTKGTLRIEKEEKGEEEGIDVEEEATDAEVEAEVEATEVIEETEEIEETEVKGVKEESLSM